MIRAILTLAVYLSGGLACAATPSIEAIQVGFGGKYRVGRWTPVWITLAGGEQDSVGSLEISVPDSDGLVTNLHRAGESINVPAGSSVRTLRYFKAGRVNGYLRVTWRGQHDTTTRTFYASTSSTHLRPAIPIEQQFIVCVGDDCGMEEALRLLRSTSEEDVVHSIVKDPADLPRQPLGYQGVDVLLIAAEATDRLKSLTADQADAVVQWIRQGGRSIFAVGAGGEEILEGDGPWAQLAPGRLLSVVQQRQTSGLEVFADSKTRLDAVKMPDNKPFALPMTVVDAQDGMVLATTGSGTGRPAVVHHALGLGEVMFVGLDLDQGPLALWSERPNLVLRLLQPLLRDPGWDRERNRQVSGAHLGFDDLSGQLRAGMDQYTNVTPIAFSILAALLVVYILLIGPGDYFLLRRFGDRRMAWTWVTFPLVVAAFCAVAVYLAYATKGSQLRINQVEVVDVDATTGQVRGSAWSFVYSPRTQTYDLSWRVEGSGKIAPPQSALLSWHGLPGKGLGGMHTTSARDLVTEGYRVEVLPEKVDSSSNTPLESRLLGTPLQVWSSKGFHCRWTSSMGDPGAATTGTRSADGLPEHERPKTRPNLLSANTQLKATPAGLLQGELSNPLSVPLTDCLVVYDRWAYRLRRNELPPDARVSMDAFRSPRTLQWLLTKREIVDQQEVIARWDQSARDVPNILQMMMFHAAAGGPDYTGLTSRDAAELDLSNHVKLDRAILVGRVRAKDGELAGTHGVLYDGEESLQPHYQRTWQFVRIVLPVEPYRIDTGNSP